MGEINQLLIRGTKIELEKAIQEHAIVLAHEGHMGVFTMKQIIRTKVGNESSGVRMMDNKDAEMRGMLFNCRYQLGD